MFKNLTAIVFVLLLSSPASAQTSHDIAAREAFDASMAIENRKLVAQAVETMLRKFPEDRPFATEYEQFISETLASAEFAAAKTRVYRQTFSEAELKQLTELFRSPGYRLVQERQPELDSANRKALADALTPRATEFVRRLDAVKSRQIK